MIWETDELYNNYKRKSYCTTKFITRIQTLCIALLRQYYRINNGGKMIMKNIRLQLILLGFFLLLGCSAVINEPEAEVSSPILHYPFTGNAQDESGNGHDGLVNNAILVSDRFGNENSAYEFDGETSFIDCGDILNDLQVPFTICAWIKNFSNDRGQAIFYTDVHESFTSHNYHGMGLALSIYAGDGVTLLDSTQLSVRYGDGLGTGYQYRRTKHGTSFLSNNGWIYVSGVVEGPQDMKLYINGIEEGGTYSGSGEDMAHNSWHAYIGRRFHGLIDDLRVYDEALNAEQINIIFQE